MALRSACVIVLFVLKNVYGSTLHDENSGSLPGVAMEYKVHVDAGKEDCYYQNVEPGASIYVSFQVLRGGDGNAGFGVKNPQGHFVHPYQWKSASEYEEHQCKGGFYQICVDNQFSKLASKLVYLFITTFRFEEWEKYSSELEIVDISIGNFTVLVRIMISTIDAGICFQTTLSDVESRIQEMLRYQQTSRRYESLDYNIILSSNHYITYWSVLQCFVIVFCGAFQVYFVKKLFSIKSVKPGT